MQNSNKFLEINNLYYQIMENVTFFQPKREILSPMDMSKWIKSQVE